jgi:hypothetical protein
VSFRKRLLVACFLGHFFLIFCVCSRDTFLLIAGGYSSLPASLTAVSEKVGALLSSALGDRLARSNLVRQTLNLYLRAAGIEVGYGFFAPNVPDNYKIVFELHYADGRVEYELPKATNEAAALRLTTLIDNIGDIQYEPLRGVLVRMMAYAIWREHPDATVIRAVLGFVILPSPNDFRHGIKESYQTIRAYDFVFSAREGAR